MNDADLLKYRKSGEIVNVHCCDVCVRQRGKPPKVPAESGVDSWLCSMCGHYNVGSTMPCKVGDWFVLEMQ